MGLFVACRLSVLESLVFPLLLVTLMGFQQSRRGDVVCRGRCDGFEDWVFGDRYVANVGFT